MKKIITFGTVAIGVIAGLALVQAQQSDIRITLTGGEKLKIALPELRGTGAAQAQMAVFNETLNADIAGSGYFDVLPKTSYPLQAPQRPQDFKAPVNGAKQGMWLTDWANAPVNADYLAFGYTAEQTGQLALFGYLYNVRQPDLANAHAIGKVYFGPLNAEGARKVAHEFAADILALAGVKSLAGTKIYFTSTRTGTREIWVMDYDGANQKQVTSLRSLLMSPVLSPDGTKLAFSTFRGGWQIMILSTQTGRQLPYYNQRASLVETPEFTADGKVMFASTAAGGPAQIFLSNADGSGLQRVSNSRALDLHPRVNPKNPNEIAFTSGRYGPLPQIYRMNLDGTNAELLSGGDGEAVQPAWSPNGQHLAFAWTRGFAPGNYNIFVMDPASKSTEQLTHGAGRNENPSWAPDGRHIVFASNRAGGTQIWTMLADGTGLKQLTTQGKNEMPVWSAAQQ